MSDDSVKPAPVQADSPDTLAMKAAALLLRYRAEETRLERELDAIQIRLEITREVIASLSGQPRRGARNQRRQWPVAVNAGEQGPPDDPPAAA